MNGRASPAGFVHRYAAWSLDAACIGVLACLVAWPWLPGAWMAVGDAVAVFFAAAGRGLHAAFVAGATPVAAALDLAGDAGLQARAAALRVATLHLLLPWLAAYAAIALAWHGLGVASRRQASPGKCAFGLFVAASGGGRPGLRRALGRHLAAGLSWVTLNIGHLLALGPAHAALHDRIARTRVLRRDGARRLPRAAVAWLAVQAACGLLGLAWLPGAVERLVLAGLP